MRYVSVDGEGNINADINPPYEINVPEVWIPVPDDFDTSCHKYVDGKWIEFEPVVIPSENEEIMLAITDMYETISTANASTQEDIASLMLALADIYEKETTTTE